MTLTARMPRVRCPEHGVKMLPAPWATRPRVGTTRRFERLAIAWLKVCSVRETAVRLGVSDKQIARIQHDAVVRGKARLNLQPPTVVHVDETAYQKGHKYVTVINDADGRVRWVAPGRDSKTLGTYYKSLGQHGLKDLRHAVMDMSKAYIKATLEHTSAAIVIDKFHVAARLNKAVDQVRRAEHRELLTAGDDRLKGTQHLFRRSAATMKTDQREQLGYFTRLSFKVARAWQRCEMARQLWSLTDRETAMVGWRKWLKSARLSRLTPLRKAAETVEEHLEWIVNASTTGLSNGRAESTNARIQTLKRQAHGFRNINNFCDAIMFRYGGLDLSV